MESARKEAYEEAGVNGDVIPQLVGEYQYEKWGGTCHVKVYPLKVNEILNQWPEDYFRDRKWLRWDDALDHIDNNKLKQIIKKLPRILKKNGYVGSN